MSTVEINKIESDIFPLLKGEESQSVHFEALRERMWLLEHPCAGNIDTTIQYGKWAGDANHFLYVEYYPRNWIGWNPETEYNPGSPVVKYRWGGEIEKVDLFVFKGTAKGDVLDVNPPVMGGKLNSLWLLTVDPNKYSHWNSNAGRPDIEADGRWIISQHGWDDPAMGGEGWLYGLWKAYQELPTHTDPYEQIPHLKINRVSTARHHPVERDRDDITIKLQTQSRRSYQNGFIGVDPITWWYDHGLPTMVSEHIRLNGDPIDSIQWGPDYREPKKNSAFQDRIQHLIEQNYNYITKVDDDWKLAWQHWYVYGVEMSTSNIAGCSNPVYNRVLGGFSDDDEWVYGGPPYPNKGEVVWHNNYFWLAVGSGGEWVEPGTDETEWASILYQPNYIKAHPVYVQFSDPLFYCNSSAFEKVLKNIGHCDWYWDPNAAVPWWMYQKHYYLRTQELADPGVGHLQDALQRWPMPRGCWRRVWRYTMNWDKTRNQKSRFGKEININGQMVSMMWPGELGNPPGYDEQFTPSMALLDYRNTKPGWHWNDLTYQHIITEAQYNAIQEDPTYGWVYKQHYTVMDVEGLFRQAYLANSSIESRIAERHDPVTTDWIRVFNEQTQLWEDEEVPIFEIYCDLVNDMRDALLQLKLFKQTTIVTVLKYESRITSIGPFPTTLEAYTAAKAHCDAEIDVYPGGAYYVVGYRMLVEVGGGAWVADASKYWVETTITKDVNINFPAKEVGTLVFDIFAVMGSTLDINDACEIGVEGSFTYKPPHVDYPPYDYQWQRAFVGQIPVTCEQVYTGVGGNPEDWTLQCKFRVMPVSPWPPEEYFNFVTGERFWGRETWVDIEAGANKALAWELNFDGFDESVFEEDPYNFIEV